MARVVVIGDQHFSRKLPHRKIRGDGRNDRYEFQKRLFRTVINPFDIIISLGDITHEPNMVDGLVAKDYMEAVRNKYVIQILGNHDRHNELDTEGVPCEASLGEIAAASLGDRYKIVLDTHLMELGAFVMAFTSYYATEEQIRKVTEQAVELGKEKGKQVFVFGHWNFYNEMMGGKKVPIEWAKQMNDQGAYFVLGHIHPPQTIPGVGEYLGVMNPVQFGETQGSVLSLDTDTGEVKRFPYPFGEAFWEGEYGGPDAIFPWEHEDPYDMYIKIKYDGDIYDRDDVRADLMKRFDKCRQLIIVPIVKEILPGAEDAAASELIDSEQMAGEEDIIREVARERNLDADLMLERHRSIKQQVG